MKRFSTTATALPPSVLGPVGKAWDEVSASFERFCLAAGIEALGAMMEKDAEEACGPRHAGKSDTSAAFKLSCGLCRNVPSADPPCKVG